MSKQIEKLTEIVEYKGKRYEVMSRADYVRTCEGSLAEFFLREVKNEMPEILRGDYVQIRYRTLGSHDGVVISTDSTGGVVSDYSGQKTAFYYEDDGKVYLIKRGGRTIWKRN